MNIFEYVGSEIEHISFINKEITIKKNIKAIKKTHLNNNELKYLIFNACIYGLDEVFIAIIDKFYEQSLDFIKKEKLTLKELSNLKNDNLIKIEYLKKSD